MLTSEKKNINLISVIIPVFNGEKTLASCLRSVLNQDRDFFELIIVDNASDDRSAAIIQEYARYDKRIKYVFESNKGRGRARNAALRLVSGDIVAMTDVDCIVPRNWLSGLTKKIISGEAVAVMGFEDDILQNYWTKMRQIFDKKAIFSEVQDDLINHLDTKNFACKASIIKEVGFDDNLESCEDSDLLLNLKKRNFGIHFVPEVCVAHFHDASLRELLQTQRSRAFSYSIILRKHDLPKEKIINFFTFPVWALWRIIRNPYRAPYHILSDLAWKLGVIDYYLDKRR